MLKFELDHNTEITIKSDLGYIEEIKITDEIKEEIGGYLQSREELNKEITDLNLCLEIQEEQVDYAQNTINELHNILQHIPEKVYKEDLINSIKDIRKSLSDSYFER